MNSLLKHASGRLTFFLYLIALHSICVGLGLIFLPDNIFFLIGFEISPNRFFETQGGVFHLIMAMIYSLAAFNPKDNRILIWISISAKGIAVGFLWVYYFFISPIWMIFISGVGDAAVGIILLYLLQGFDSDHE